MSDRERCQHSDLYRLKESGQYEAEMFRLLLHAKASGQKVTILLQDCEGAYPVARYLTLE
jgi:hypothetical protein